LTAAVLAYDTPVVDNATLIETLGVVFGIAGVWLTIRQNIWCWPVGIVSVSAFAYVFFGARLYGSAGLQLAYVGLSAYGWYSWRRPQQDGGTLHVTRAPRPWNWSLGAAGALCAAGLGLLLRDHTNASLPFIDAGTTSFSLVAQFMSTRKWIENWLIWIVVDLVYVGMYLSQRLYPTTGLYAAFLVLAVLGYREWRISMRVTAGVVR